MTLPDRPEWMDPEHIEFMERLKKRMTVYEQWRLDNPEQARKEDEDARRAIEEMTPEMWAQLDKDLSDLEDKNPQLKKLGQLIERLGKKLLGDNNDTT